MAPRMRGTSGSLFLGLDFGTESARAVLVDRRGRTLGQAVSAYAHGQILPGSVAAGELFDRPLPAGFALQHPGDWVESACAAVQGALAAADLGSAEPAASRVGGIGVDFTSCTMLPCRADGTPLCLAEIGGSLSPLARHPHAWPKLWKHHGAVAQTERLNELARSRNEPWLGRYGGAVGLEWFFPKLLEVVERSPAITDAGEVWLEAGDWLVWRLVGGDAAGLPRSTCHAGYKACWSAEGGYPSEAFLEALHPALAQVSRRCLPGRFVAPGRPAGTLCESMARLLGVPAGIPVSAAIIDAHAGVPGAGVAEPGTLVMVMGTSGCHMLLAERGPQIPGVAGIVRDGILPGFHGYETGQAAVGDAFEWARRLAGGCTFEDLGRAAADVPPGCDGLLCVDWFNGCRTPLMDGRLAGGFIGMTLSHGPACVYRSVLEASAMGLRWIVETLRGTETPAGQRVEGVPVERFVATGGLARRSRLFLEIVASVLGAPIDIHGAEHGSAQGAAILGALAAGSAHGGFDDAKDAAREMAGLGSAVPAPSRVEPRADWIGPYRDAYRAYRQTAAAWGASGWARRAHA